MEVVKLNRKVGSTVRYSESVVVRSPDVFQHLMPCSQWPQHQLILEVPTTGKTWTGPAGGLWVELAQEKPGWLLVRTLDEGSAMDVAIVAIVLSEKSSDIGRLIQFDPSNPDSVFPLGNLQIIQKSAIFDGWGRCFAIRG